MAPREQSRIGSLTRRIGTEEHFRWLEGIIKTILFLNLIDAVLTMIWVYSGQATEGNPILEDLVHNHPIMFVVVKFTLVSLGSFLLWRLRKRPLAVVGIFVAFLLYYALLLYHLRAMELHLFDRLFS